MQRADRVASIAVLVLAAIAYGPVVARLTATWWTDSEYSHGLICAPLAAAIVYSRRRELAGLRIDGRRAGLYGAAASAALLLLGTLGAEVFLTRASLLLFLASAIVFLFGWRHLRAVAFPFAIIALSIPIPALLMEHITLPLQFAASSVAETTLSSLHIPVLREGNVLVLADATLQVAEACSGVRSMMSLLVLAIVIAKMMERHPITRTAIVLAAVPVAIAVNAVRVTTTAIATEYYGIGAAEGLLHEALGVVLFIASAALLVGCARLVAAMSPRLSLRPSL